MLKKVVFVAAIAAALTGAGASAASVSSGSTARADGKIVVAVASQYTALVAAKKQGVFKGINVSFVPMRFTKGVVQAVQTGKATFGIGDSGVTLWQTVNFQIPLQIVAGVSAYKTGQSAMLAGGSYPDGASLYGQKVGIPERGGVYHLSGLVWLDGNGAETNNASFSEMRPAQMAAAISGNKVAAAVAPAPFNKGKSLGDPVEEAFGAGAPLSIAIALQTTIASQSATVKAFVAALGKVSGLTTKLNLDALDTIGGTLNDYALTDEAPDLETLVWSGAPQE
jgi:ABC-type nitrate/sulfonate/bicarbonate transport system substrate-binding protein